MPVIYDDETNDFEIFDATCCGEPMYDSGCAAPGCRGYTCELCGAGCDLDFAPQSKGRCARALAAQDPGDEIERANRSRAAWGLPPLGGPSGDVKR